MDCERKERGLIITALILALSMAAKFLFCNLFELLLLISLNVFILIFLLSLVKIIFGMGDRNAEEDPSVLEKISIRVSLGGGIFSYVICIFICYR